MLCENSNLDEANTALLDDIKKEYFKSTVIYVDSNKEAQYQASRTEIQQFFDRDEKFIMKQ